jgi:polyisoprenoid-binding protein YceI
MRNTIRLSFFLLCAFLVFGRNPLSGTATEDFRVDVNSSKVAVNVGKSGLFKVAGHPHEVVAPAFTGRVTIDRADLSRSVLSLEFDAGALKVTGKDEPAEDVPQVQSVMVSDRVLDVKRYPKITFVSRSISLMDATRDGAMVRITGDLTLHGITKSVTVPARVRFDGAMLTATGSTTVRQTLFGIEPVTAGAGTIKVKDEVEIVFTIVARHA